MAQEQDIVKDEVWALRFRWTELVTCDCFDSRMDCQEVEEYVVAEGDIEVLAFQFCKVFPEVSLENELDCGAGIFENVIVKDYVTLLSRIFPERPHDQVSKRVIELGRQTGLFRNGLLHDF